MNNKIERNSEISFIFDTFDDLVLNKFKCDKNEMEQNGEIFYFNGDNGSKFDWFENGHISTLAMIYPDGTEAVKIHIYEDGSVKAYYYKRGSMKPDSTVNTKINKDIAKNIAILLYTISDKVGLFNKKLTSLDLNYILQDSDVNEFDND